MIVCHNHSTSSLSLFVSDLPSYGVIGLVTIGLILYIAYLISYFRNRHVSRTFYTFVSQLFLLFTLLSSISFLLRPSSSMDSICSIQNFLLQMCPFALLLSYNIHFVHQWLQLSTSNSSKKTCLISISSALISFLALLIECAILLIWFYNHQSYRNSNETCSTECSRPLFLCSLSLNFFLLFLYSFQSSLRYHFYNERKDFIALLASLLAIAVTICWVSFYLCLPNRSFWAFSINSNFILAYGMIFFVYSFLGPFLFEQLFYQTSAGSHRFHVKEQQEKSKKKLTFQSLSLTKEQQRAFMAAYIKRNLTASCENLTSITISSPFTINRPIDEQFSRTCHSTLSVDSLCPTLASTVSHEQPAVSLLRPTTTDTSSSATVTSEYLLLASSPLTKNEN